MNGPSGATGTAANTSDQGGATGPVRTFANSLVADVAQALRSYGTAASASSPASAMSSGLALAA